MRNVIISDASCLIVLDNVDALELLKALYGSIYITPDILNEFDRPIPDWILVRSVIDQDKISLLEIQIDRGEASALALAMEIGECLVIIDDLKARKIADKLKIKMTGTLGVIIAAKRKGHLSSIKPILSKIRSTNFRLSADLENEALRLSGEQ
jgi:predicted nucleic acid-binding protein